METYIKVYDWMAELPLEERFVYALIYQLTFSKGADGFWSTLKTMANRINIPKNKCKAAIQHLVKIGAITMIEQTTLHKTHKTYFATKEFADALRDE